MGDDGQLEREPSRFILTHRNRDLLEISRERERESEGGKDCLLWFWKKKVND